MAGRTHCCQKNNLSTRKQDFCGTQNMAHGTHDSGSKSKYNARLKIMLATHKHPPFDEESWDISLVHRRERGSKKDSIVQGFQGF